MTTQAMPQVTQVVVGVDGSESALHAALWAADEAALRGVPLTVVHALGVTEAIAPALDPGLDQGQEPTAGDRLLETTLHDVREHCLDLAAQGQLSALAPVEQLTELSAPDTLVVIGTRGHGALMGMLLGSVSRAMVKHTRGPLVIVRGPRAARHAGNVVLGAGPGAGPGAARFAFDAAQCYRARVRAVRTRPPLPVPPGVPGAVDLPLVMPAGGGIRSMAPPQTEMIQAELEDAAEREQALAADLIDAARASCPNVAVEVTCGEGDAALTLAEHAEDAALVVLGAPCARHRGSFTLTPGHVTGRLLAHCPAPVAVVPEPQAPPANGA